MTFTRKSISFDIDSILKARRPKYWKRVTIIVIYIYIYIYIYSPVEYFKNELQKNEFMKIKNTVSDSKSLYTLSESKSHTPPLHQDKYQVQCHERS